MKYFGYKLIMLATLEGVPVCYDLLPANTDERLAAEQLLEQVRHCQLLCDKGFIGAFWQQEVLETLEVRVMTAKRKNQQEQNPQELDTVVGSLRQRMEGVFNELQNLGKNLERLLAKTVVGLGTRVAALVTSHTLKLFLRKVYHMDVQTFSFID
ncbi:MAG: transposase [Deinococcota bacterium]|nr:transposase [Deinococcota bacterium]